jgi:hypothetical protein
MYPTLSSVGRLDDVIIHSSGEKTVPAPIEAIITASPLYASYQSDMQHSSDFLPSVFMEQLCSEDNATNPVS